MGVKEKFSKKRKMCYKKHYIMCSMRRPKPAMTTEFLAIMTTFILFKKAEQNEGQWCQDKTGPSYYSRSLLLSASNIP
jgi:hypothetical protein